MNAWPTACLGEILQPAKAPRMGRNDYPILSITMHEGLVPQADRFKKRIASKDTSQYKVAARNQLVVAFPIDEAVLDFQTLFDFAAVSPAYAIWESRPGADFDVEYLRLFLHSPAAIRQYLARLRGTTARRRSLTQGDFQSIALPLPPRSEQRHIARNLKDSARALRNSQQLRNDLAMLPIRSAQRIHGQNASSTIPLREIVHSLEAGKSFPDLSDEPAGVWKVLRTGAVTTGSFNPEDSKFLPIEYEPPSPHRISRGDLLITRNNTEDLVGAAAYVWELDAPLTVPDRIWRANWRDEKDATPLYVWASLRAPLIRRAIGRAASGTSGSMKSISKQKMLDIRIPWPSLRVRHDFETMVKRWWRYTKFVEQQKSCAQELYDSLQYRAFRGEL